jgi:Fe-S cluster biogenesis protein NfuA
MCDACGCGGEVTFQKKIEEQIELIRPNLQSHGGDIELVEVDVDNNVKVKLTGACSGCPGAQMTLKNGVEKLLREKVPELKELIAVN